VEHVVVPLDPDHVAAVAALTADAAAAMGRGAPARSQPHVTLVAYTGPGRAAAREALADVAAEVAPFVLRAHGYGVFARTGHSGLSLHVPVVRNRQLDQLHARVVTALTTAGAEVAGWSQPELWSPHVTLLDRDLTATDVGAGIAALASRHHPSWHVPVDRLQLRGGWADPAEDEAEVRFSRS
jgi:2'-5' RNA ligase